MPLIPAITDPYLTDLSVDSPPMAASRQPDQIRLLDMRSEDQDLIALVWAWDRGGRKFRVYHGHNEGKLEGRGREWRQRERKGTCKGWPDLIFVQPFRHAERDRPGVVIELKRGDGTISDVTPEQEAWILHFRACGWLAEWCRGFAEADAFLRRVYG
jgi:hypothetical protein